MIKAIVIDDEPMARDTIEIFTSKFAPEINLVGKADSVQSGLELIRKLEPQIVFLDINMPEQNGFALFDNLSDIDVKIIFTTAYSEYAIKALNLSASYYLLKPISPQDFKEAVEKTIQKISIKQTDFVALNHLKTALLHRTEYQSKLLINTKNGYEILDTANIMYFEGDKNYTWIIHENNKTLVPKTLKEFEEILDPTKFFRTHQSHLVNRNFVKKVLNTKPDQLELSNGHLLNLSRDKKKQFLEWLVS